jgi:exoribonuclease R
MRYYADYTTPINDSEANGIIDVTYLHNAIGTITCIDERKITIEGLTNLNRAWHGDAVHVSSATNGITSIIASPNRNVQIPVTINLYDKQKYGLNKKGMPIYLCRPLSNHYPPIHVASSAALKYRNTSCVYALVSLIEWNVDQRYPRGICHEVLGPVGIEHVDFLVRAHAHGLFNGHGTLVKSKDLCLIDIDTPDIIMHESAPVFSIDPPGCIDIDDAVNVVDHGNDTYTVGIHIADVTAYIEPNSDIDKEARCRAQTIYLPHKQVPIIPEALAHDKCSLLPHTDKRTLSCLITFQGSVPIAHIFKRTCIRSVAALTYADVDARRINNPKIISAISILERLFGSETINNSHVLVEKLMILANTFAAERLLTICNNCPVLVRRQCAQTNMQYGHLLSNQAAEYIVVDKTTLLDTIGHASIGVAAYTHFTSPIRRYADQVVHRLLLCNMSLCDNALINHLNSQHKAQRRFQRDADILRCIYGCLPSLTATGYGVIMPLRTSRKHKTLKVDVAVSVDEYSFTYPFRVLSAALQSAISVSYDGNLVTLTNNQTRATCSLVVGQSIPLTIHFRPQEAMLYDKCVISSEILDSLYFVDLYEI